MPHPTSMAPTTSDAATEAMGSPAIFSPFPAGTISAKSAKTSASAFSDPSLQRTSGSVASPAVCRSAEAVSAHAVCAAPSPASTFVCQPNSASTVVFGPRSAAAPDPTKAAMAGAPRGPVRFTFKPLIAAIKQAISRQSAAASADSPSTASASNDAPAAGGQHQPDAAPDDAGSHPHATESDMLEAELAVAQLAMDIASEMSGCMMHRGRRTMSDFDGFDNNMRTMLTIWMREAVSERKHTRKTFHLSVCFFDIFVSRVGIADLHVDDMQILAVACTQLAAKIEELDVPSTAEMLGFTVQDVKPEDEDAIKFASINKCNWFEKTLVMTLEFECILPTCIDFLRALFQLAVLAEPRSRDGVGRAGDVVIDDISVAQQPQGMSVLDRNFNPLLFAEAASLLDQAVCQEWSLGFTHYTLAATAFHVAFERALASRGSSGDAESFWPDGGLARLFETVTGCELCDIQECLAAMERQRIEDVVANMGERMADLIVEANARGDAFDLIEHQIVGVAETGGE
ncbi:G1/S-specific cyclin-E1 [Polyrhizophydium stewartii]|uniref:G1/S-specific cyclin-E1 n=1 Tax=Polyrhizophydium stewartii TaxID=2732419 RepID=A0ABR4N5X4_9FUNG